MKRYAIYGAGGCGRGIMPLVRQQLQLMMQADVVDLVFVDDKPPSTIVNGARVMTYAHWLKLPASSRHVCIAIANTKVREQLTIQCTQDRVSFFEVSASNVIKLDNVQLGEGAVLCPFVTLASNIKIGKHFHANLYSYVEHDCEIGDYVTFAPGVMCNGNVLIEDHVNIGAGAIIKPGVLGVPLVIGRGAVVGMGAVVTKSVPAGITVVGNPARLLVKV
jgi:sugar O-acyltransferase (sialic acid O-acetyltransferase NeuD family)